MPRLTQRQLRTYAFLGQVGGGLEGLSQGLTPFFEPIIIRHAGDRFLIVDDILLPLREKFRE